jgi:hypothetical protein
MAEDLKSIFMIGRNEPHWADVKQFLSKIDATVFTLNYDDDLGMLESMNPSLLIMNPGTYFEMPSLADSFMKLIIKEEEFPTPSLQAGGGKRAVVIDWPQEERVFLKLVTKLLAVSPRRSFRALIRILPRGGSVNYMGESEDFSLTGIGFLSKYELQPGEEVEISFSVPTNRQTANFDVEVVRCLPCDDDQANRYGARYVNLTPHIQEVMDKFIRDI